MVLVNNIKIDPKDKNKLTDILKKKFSPFNSYIINRESIDARKDVKIIYSIIFDVNDEDKFIKKHKDSSKYIKKDYKYRVTGSLKMKYRPVIVGAGPSGLFAAYFLSLEGFKPLIIEMGKDIDERDIDVNNFFNTNKLNINSNVQFGLGGAGLFSDGKLNTGISDKSYRINKVLELFVKFGANKDILYSNRPHIGTDILKIVIKNMKEEIERLGGEFMFNSKLTSINISNNKVDSIIINDSKVISCDNLILAIGHSSRDTFYMLNDKGVYLESKPFAVGFRVSHKQDLINKSQYGEAYKYLDSASYKLTYNSLSHYGVYSFSMCPGGYIVNASSFKDRLCVNGMSLYKRDSGYANSAIVISVSKKDYGEELFDGVKFQEQIEKKAYEIGNSFIPVQLYKDFKDNVTSTSKIESSFKGNTYNANLRDILPDYLNKDIIDAMEYFGSKIKGFNSSNTVLAGIESRTSSPIRINRDLSFNSNIKGIYPIGEGAGYAGGITSSAVDGIKCFEKIIEIYKNC